MPYTNHQYVNVKLELYDKPAWDTTATLEETLTNLTEFMAKSQQWWIPIAWSEEDDVNG